MNINPLNIGKAIAHFFIGMIAMYITWNVVPTILDILDTVNLTVNGWGEIKGIIWFGIVILSIIYMIGYPVWVLFDED